MKTSLALVAAMFCFSHVGGAGGIRFSDSKLTDRGNVRLLKRAWTYHKGYGNDSPEIRQTWAIGVEDIN